MSSPRLGDTAGCVSGAEAAGDWAGLGLVGVFADGCASRVATVWRESCKLGAIADGCAAVDGNQIALVIGTDRSASASLLETSSNALRSQLDEAGLTLASIGIDMISPPSDDHDGA